jgi:hypothetical protein
MLEKLKKILSEVKPYEKDHHMGLPFLSAYQLAVEFERQYPDEASEIEILPKTIAKTLSQAIKNRDCVDIEGGFISHENLNVMEFSNGYEITQQNAHSIFRYRGS